MNYLGRKQTGGTSLFRRAVSNSPRLFQKVGDISERIARTAGSLAVVFPEFAPQLGALGGVAETVAFGSKALKASLERKKR